MATHHHETPVLIVGAGPSGLILSLQLARHGIQCMLAERNLDTTKWPKMDVTNCRSMELFNRLGISNGLRDQGVGQDYSFNVLFSTGLSERGQLIAQWDLPSPNVWRERIKANNDGSLPREPYQRCSQAIFEAWLKPRIEAESSIDTHFGLKFESLVELDDGIISTLVNTQSGEKHIVKSKYVVGCDGAGSRVRSFVGSELVGGPVPMAMLLVHFKSQDLAALQKQGQFWHIFFTSGAVIISQDEATTWTAHLPIPLDVDWEGIDPVQAVYDVLGGSAGSYSFKIDEVLVKSAWRPKICVADKYTSSSGRIFLSGDAAHQNIPTGGYGMNTAVGDSFDLGWKLAAALNGYGGDYLLKSYEVERKPVAVRNIERSGIHQQVHFDYADWVRSLADPSIVCSDSDDGRALRQKIADHVLSRDGENQDHGIEMDYRFTNSPIVVPEDGAVEPEWQPRRYFPSTLPGTRAPHVYLQDGITSVMDLYGSAFTIVDFTDKGMVADQFVEAASKLGIPITKLHLPKEDHVAQVWGREVVLVRPDDHVAWRLPKNSDEPVDAETVLKIATGQEASAGSAVIDAVDTVREKGGFTSTTGNVDDTSVEMRAEFQR